MKKSIITLILIMIYKAFGSFCHSQIAIEYTDEIVQIKKGTTYIAMNNPDAEKNKEYIEVFKENWKISNIRIVDYDQIEELLSPNSYFLTIGGYVTETQFVRLGFKYNFGNFKLGDNERTLDKQERARLQRDE